MEKVSQYWDVWASLFNGIPNGDPYVAMFTLLVLMVVTLKMARSAIESM